MSLGMPSLLEFNSVQENIDFALNSGFDFIELNLNMNYVSEQMSQHIALSPKLFYTLHFLDSADFATYKEITDGYIKIFKKFIKISKRQPIKGINIHLNVGPIVTISGVTHYLYENEYDTYFERLVLNLTKLKKLCSKNNMYLVIENIVSPPHVLKTFNNLAQLGFNFTYDIGHDYTDKRLLLPFVKKHNQSFLEYHYHDSTKDKCHLSLGEGDVSLADYAFLAKDKQIVLEVKSQQDLIKSIKVFKSL